MEQEKAKFQYYIGGMMRLVSNEVSGTFRKKVAVHDLSIGEWMVLRSVYEADLKSPSDVAKYTNMTRGGLSKVIEKLKQKKLMTRKENSDDRRYQKIQLTEEAKALFPRLINISKETDEQFFSCLTTEERKKFREMLDKIAESNQISGIPLK